MAQSNDISSLWNGDMSEEVSSRFERIRDFIADKSVHICTSCGSEMLLMSGCLRCPTCGEKSCGE